MTYTRAIQKIRSLIKVKNIDLDLNLGSHNLDEIPKEINVLINLKELNLEKNKKLVDLTPISMLNRMSWLDISGTSITNLGPLEKLTRLKELYADNTPIVDLAPISDLKNLVHLSLNHTSVTDLAPLSRLKELTYLSLNNSNALNLNSLSNLTKLQSLHLDNTIIEDLGPLSNLKNLRHLSIQNTNIYNLEALCDLKELSWLILNKTLVSNLRPLKIILQRNVKIKINSSPQEIGIHINNCPVIDPPLEIMSQGNDAILRYWKQIELQEGTVELFEAKLIIIGEGGTGKTTLFEKLKDDAYEVSHTPETHGINIYEGLPFKHTNIGKNTFRANLWDFGGQDLQYMTHQFFLTPRALYVLMMDARRESPNLAYWFKIISLLGRESEDSKEKVKLLLVFNKRANSTGLPLYQDTLKFYEEAIDSTFLEVDLALNDYRFKNLRNSIQNHLIDLPIVKSKLPRLWKYVRESLRNESKQKNYISTQRFAKICSKHQIDDEKDQWVLSGYLHQLGSLLHFQNDKGLRSWVILNPQWAVDGVYSFLTDKKIVSNYGHFKEADFIQLLAAKGYSREGADLILQLMTKNNFDICYKASTGRYVAAQLLPDVAPAYPWYPPREMLQFRYQYSIMPKGLMSRLIVRLSDDLEVNQETGKQIVWKKGGVFRIKSREGECRVRLREDDAESKSGVRQIMIEVTGEENARKLALYKIRNEVDDLHHKWFRSLKPDEFIPCRCSKCIGKDDPELYKLEKLLMKSTKRKDTSCDSSGEDILIQTLLEGIYDQQEIYNMKRER